MFKPHRKLNRLHCVWFKKGTWKKYEGDGINGDGKKYELNEAYQQMQFSDFHWC